MPVEVATNKVIDLRFGDGMQVLELVHGRELDDVEPIGQDAICQRQEDKD